MALLSSSIQIQILHQSKACIFGHFHSSLFHSSSFLLAKHYSKNNNHSASVNPGPSRRRLVKDLKSSSRSSAYEVAPSNYEAEPKPSFARDSVPHTNALPIPQREERLSFRRRTKEGRTLGSSRRRWDERLGRSAPEQRRVDESRHNDSSHRKNSDRQKVGSRVSGFGLRDNYPVRKRFTDRSEGSSRNLDLPKTKDQPVYLKYNRDQHLHSDQTPQKQSNITIRHSGNTPSRQSPISPERSENTMCKHNKIPAHQLHSNQAPSTRHQPTFASRHTGNASNSELSNSGTSASDSDSAPRPPKIRNLLPAITEFYHPPPSPSRSVPPHLPQAATDPSSSTLPTKFTSPPLMPGLLASLKDVLGPDATPTPIQALSLKWLLNNNDRQVETTESETAQTTKWKQFLLASETGSGKSIAYLLPVLQALKEGELRSGDAQTQMSSPSERRPRRALNPRALILAPTHELARQLSGFAKALLHVIKLRVLCASQANVKSSGPAEGTARQMAGQFARTDVDGAGEFEVQKGGRAKPVDIIVGTPMKLLEMVRGRGWDRKEEGDKQDEIVEGEGEWDPDKKRRKRRGRDLEIGEGKRIRKGEPEMGLENVEWVVVDEADVLFDPDFQETTRMLLADISSARGEPVILSSTDSLAPPTQASNPPQVSNATSYPFNLLLTSATIPTSLAAYLDAHHPHLTRLASPNLHHLPKTLQTEYVSWTGGNKNADIERRIRRVWAEDSSFGGVAAGRGFVDDTEIAKQPHLSKVLIFCNKNTKVEELGTFLEERGIKNVALTSASDSRKRGSNHHLDGFLRTSENQALITPISTTSPSAPAKRTLQLIAKQRELAPLTSDPAAEAHVMITTSLLSRGLDFSPAIRHVFIVDEPRNMIDFLHRAGRSGRAGQRGKVVIFGKMKGRGSAKAKDIRKRVGSLTA